VGRVSFPDRVALVVADSSPAAFLTAVRRAGNTARLAEFRLDALGSVEAIVAVLDGLARRRPKLAWIATCRRRVHEGGFDGSASAELAVLELAARAGAAWIDTDARTLESSPPRLRAALRPRAGCIVSFHNFLRTPSRLESLYRRLARLGADIVKIATMARSQSDNIRILNLARRHRRRVVALAGAASAAAGKPPRRLGLADLLRAGRAAAHLLP